MAQPNSFQWFCFQPGCFQSADIGPPHGFIVTMPAVSDGTAPVFTIVDGLVATSFLDSAPTLGIPTINGPFWPAVALVAGSPVLGTPTLTVPNTAIFDVGGANVIDLFPVYDVVYTYAPLNLRTG